MELIYRIFMCLSSTFWMWTVFVIKSESVEWFPFDVDRWIVNMAFVIIPILFCVLTLLISKKLTEDTIEVSELELADNMFLPVYLGYFFVSLSVESYGVMWWLYVIVSIFVFCSQAQYFNPVFLLLNYHFYNVKNTDGVRLFLMVKGDVIKNSEEICNKKFGTVNDITYIEV